MRHPTRKQVKAANKVYWSQAGKPPTKTKKQAKPRFTLEKEAANAEYLGGPNDN